MEQSLALRQPGGELSWADMREQASVLVKSGFLPKHVDTPEKALAIMLAGRELGVPTMAAIRGLYVIDGKVAANAQLMLALVRRSGALELFDPSKETETCATVTVKRKGEPAITISFSNEDAKTAGLTGGFAWPKYPRVMRRWRAITEALRLAFPDVLAGIYTAEEIGVGYKVEGDDIVLDIQPATPERLAANARAALPNPASKPNGDAQRTVDVESGEITEPDPAVALGLDEPPVIEQTEELTRLRSEFTKLVRIKNLDPIAVRGRFFKKYRCQPEQANIDTLNDAIALLQQPAS